jgi:hypothetical protein
VWALQPNDAWIVGDDPSVLHWDGSSWSSSTSLVAGPLWGLWASGPKDIWAVSGAGIVVHRAL